MRDHCKVGTVGGIHEEGQAYNEADHRSLIVGVEDADDDAEYSHHHSSEHKPDLLGLDGPRVAVEDVRDDTTGWSENDVEKTEHRCSIRGISIYWRRAGKRMGTYSWPDFVCPRSGKFFA